MNWIQSSDAQKYTSFIFSGIDANIIYKHKNPLTKGTPVFR